MISTFPRPFTEKKINHFHVYSNQNNIHDNSFSLLNEYINKSVIFFNLVLKNELSCTARC